MNEPTVQRIVELLGLDPHPEGGRFRETWAGPEVAGRASGTAIYFLLTSGEVSHWHRVDSAEVWHHYAGAPLELAAVEGDGPVVRSVLGTDLEAGERPQLVVAPGALAVGPIARGLDPRRVHGVARLRVRSVRTGPARLGAGGQRMTGALVGVVTVTGDGPEVDSPSGEQPHDLRCAIVGRGRVGSSFAAALGRCGWSIDLVGARSVSSSDPSDAVVRTLRGADVVLFSVPDDVIAIVARRVADLTGGIRGIAAHVSGASDLEVLAPHDRRGSVHPLVSLPNPEIGAQRLLDRCDFAIDGDPLMAVVVASLGGRSFVVSADRRAAYHAAASIAANHLVALCAQVEAIAALAEVPVDAYWRLMSTTLDNVSSVGPAAAITGPAARGDWATLRRHLDALPVDERDLYIEAADRAARLVGRSLPDDVVTSE